LDRLLAQNVFIGMPDRDRTTFLSRE